MTAAPSIEPITTDEYERLLPLIADYQRFYHAEDIDPQRNRRFFTRFLDPSDDGLLLGAWLESELAGYACLYWHFSSVAARETVLMNDLFVVDGHRGAGIGRALIEASAEVARGRGAAALEWSTAPDNDRAQRLYDSMGAEMTTWLTYEIEV